ncbi:MAG: vitamin K epoxide reductase family protein, partial [Armatimonadota bacterium]
MSVWPNRIIILLSCLGVYIAGVLSYSHFANLLVPCSSGSSCATVAVSAYSVIPPGSASGVPVAYLGLAAYATLFCLSVFRFLYPVSWKLTSKIGFWMSIAGVAFSFWLTFASISFLHTTCEWCLGSFGTMIGMLFSHAWLMQTEAPTPKQAGLNWGAVGLGLAGMITGFGIVTADMGKARSGEVIELGN